MDLDSHPDISHPLLEGLLEESQRALAAPLAGGLGLEKQGNFFGKLPS
jgi:hypothetical protein